jgi:hypothetical protein
MPAFPDPARARGRRPVAAALGAFLLLPACQALLGGDGRECATTADCLDDQICAVDRGRCVPTTGGRPDRTLDATRPDAGDATLEAGLPDARLDLRVPDESVPDPPDRDLPDLRIPDVQAPDVEPPDVLLPDAGISDVYGPAGDCFPDAPFGTFRESAGAPVPRALCTPEALLWTSTDADGLTTLMSRRGDVERALFTLPPTAPFLASGGVVLVEMPDALRGGRMGVFRFDLAEGPGAMPAAVLPAPVDHWHATRARGVTGFVEGDETTSAVVLLFDDNRTLRCGEAQHRQWGLSLGEASTAWFEQPSAGGAVDLVVVGAHACAPALRVTIPPGVEEGDRLERDGTALYWLATEAATRRRRVHTFDTARPGIGPRPVNAEGLGRVNPVEFVVNDGWLLLSAFDDRAYRLHLFDLTNGRKQQLPFAGSARAPALSGTVALWAQQVGGSPWEIHYGRLLTR